MCHTFLMHVQSEHTISTAITFLQSLKEIDILKALGVSTHYYVQKSYYCKFNGLSECGIGGALV